MVMGSVPEVGSRVNVQVFAGDLLAHQGLISVESYPNSGYSSVVLSDGAGVKVALSGDRSSLRLVVSAALEQLADSAPEPSAGE